MTDPEHRTHILSVRVTERDYLRVNNAVGAGLLSEWLREAVISAVERGAEDARHQAHGER